MGSASYITQAICSGNTGLGDLSTNLHNTLTYCCAGHFPIRLEALPEGTVIHAHVPVYQVGLASAITAGSFYLHYGVELGPCLQWAPAEQSQQMQHGPHGLVSRCLPPAPRPVCSQGLHGCCRLHLRGSMLPCAPFLRRCSPCFGECIWPRQHCSYCQTGDPLSGSHKQCLTPASLSSTLSSTAFPAAPVSHNIQAEHTI